MGSSSDLFIGGNDDRFLIHIRAVCEHLVADEADVLEGKCRL